MDRTGSLYKLAGSALRKNWPEEYYNLVQAPQCNIKRHIRKIKNTNTKCLLHLARKARRTFSSKYPQ